MREQTEQLPRDITLKVIKKQKKKKRFVFEKWLKNLTKNVVIETVVSLNFRKISHISSSIALKISKNT